MTDTGIDIAAADIPKVLGPFGQVRHDSRRAHGGTGLGLTLSKLFLLNPITLCGIVIAQN